MGLIQYNTKLIRVPTLFKEEDTIFHNDFGIGVVKKVYTQFKQVNSKLSIEFQYNNHQRVILSNFVQKI